MSSIKLYYKAVCIFIKAHWLALKYKQPVDNIYKAYTNLYFNFSMVEKLLKYCKDENKTFDIAFEDLMKAKYAIEKLFEGDSH